MSFTISAKGKDDKPAMGYEVSITKDGVEMNRHVQKIEITMEANDVVRAVMSVIPSVVEVNQDENYVKVKCSACGELHDCGAFAPGMGTAPKWSPPIPKAE